MSGAEPQLGELGDRLGTAFEAPGGRLGALGDRVLAFAGALRERGLPAAVADDLDALTATAAVDVLDRGQLREALAATLVTSGGHRRTFDALFDVYFPPRPGGEGPEQLDPSAQDADQLAAELVERLADGDEAALRRLARQAVATLGRVERRDATPGFYSHRVYARLDPAEAARGLHTPEGGLLARLAAEDVERRLATFREEVEAEVRRRRVATQSPDQAARTLATRLPEETDFFRVTADEEAEMRRQTRALARRLASRLALRPRPGRQGRLAVRRTLRRALATGGVPVTPVFQAKHRVRPQVMLLCDVSGSVAAFARFTLLFAHALSRQSWRVRSFAFVDELAEVTELLSGEDFDAAWRRVTAEAGVVGGDGRSDYGHVLQAFRARFADQITPRTTVLVLGDARTNYRAPADWVLGGLAGRARAVHWLNPEPAAHWDAGDSVARRYAVHTDGMVECRTLAQLGGFVASVA